MAAGPAVPAKTLEEQKALLRQLGGEGVGRSVYAVCALGAAACLAAGLWTRSPPWFIGMAGLVAFALLARGTLPHLQRAARALGSGRRLEVEVAIEVVEDSESRACHAVVSVAPGAVWRIDFVPAGWTPVAGVIPAEARFLSDIAWPVLLVAGEGLIVPRSTPKRIAAPR